MIPVKTRDLVSPVGGLIVLWVIQQHGSLDFRSLYELITGRPHVNLPVPYYGVIPSQEYLVTQVIEHHLERSLESGLIETQQDEAGVVRYTVSPRIEVLLNTFCIPSLSDQIRAIIDEKIVINPLFGKPDTSLTRPQVVVLMPYVAALDEFYIHHIRRVTYALELTCERIKDTFHSNSLIKKVWSAVFHSQICLADCTGGDANTFYALGIANTLGKKCILIAQSIDDIPVDLRTERTIIYDYTPAGMEQFEQTLSEILSA